MGRVVFNITENNEWLRLDEFDDEIDVRQIELHFTREVDYFQRKHRKGWDGKVPFFHKRRFLSVGFWKELAECCKSYGIDLVVNGVENLVEHSVTRESFSEWVDDFYKDSQRKPRDYQTDAAYRICRFKRSTQQLATNAGKTIIAFSAISYLMQHGLIKRALIIVPNTGLVIQAMDDFVEYGSHKVGMIFQQMYGESGDSKAIRSDANVVIGTYQSLVKREKEEFVGFDFVFVDEAHQGGAVSIRQIVTNVATVGGGKYRVGMSGTLTAKGKKSVDFFTITATLGPMIGEVTVDYLKKNNYASDVEVRIIKMSYLAKETREQLAKIRRGDSELEGSEILNLEKKLVHASRPRLNFVTDFILKTTKNSIVLFQDIENGYGKRIYDMLREKSMDKEIYYIDGDTSAKNRTEIKSRMKEGSNRILVASFGTMSTGISINNLHTIFLAESYKSETIIKQTIGRGLRQMEGKEKVIIVDFVDDFTYGAKPNYLMQHMQERIRIYEQEKHKYQIFDVDLS